MLGEEAVALGMAGEIVDDARFADRLARSPRQPVGDFCVPARNLGNRAHTRALS